MSESSIMDVANGGNSISVSSKSKKKVRNPFLETLRKARTTYSRQIYRNAKTKKDAIEYVLKISDKDGNKDNLVFRGNFYDMVTNRLLDSNRFVCDCEALEVDPFIVAQHVIFDGNQKLDEVLTSGVGNVYGNEILKMKEPIFTKEELEEGKIKPTQQSSEKAGDGIKEAA